MIYSSIVAAVVIWIGMGIGLTSSSTRTMRPNTYAGEEHSVICERPDTCETQLTVEIDYDGSLCIGDSGSVVVLEALGNFVSYAWSTGETTQTIVTSVAGLYCVTVTDILGCTGGACVELEYTSPPDVIIIGSTFLCDGFTTDLIAVTSVHPADFQWSTGTMTDGIAVGHDGTYCVTVTDSHGCTNSTCVDVHTINSTAFQIPDLTLCPDDFVLISCPDVIFGCELNGIPIQGPFYIGPGEYEFALIDQSGCRSVDSFVVYEASESIFIIDTQLCSGTLNIGGHIYTQSGDYEIVLDSTNAEGCDSIIMLSLTITDIVFADSISGNAANGYGAIAILNPEGGYPPYQFLWNTGATTSTIRELFNGKYSVTITDANGCTATKTYHLPSIMYPQPDTRPGPAVIHPNPFQSDIIIETGYVNNEKWQWEIYNQLGILLRKEVTHGNRINATILGSPGIYWIIIRHNDGQSYSQRLVKID